MRTFRKYQTRPKRSPFEIGFLAVGLIIILVFVAVGHCKLYAVETVSVYDGDSLRLKLDNDFEFDARLHGIDAPETLQHFGAACKQKLETFAAESNLRVMFLGEDIYNRKLVKIIRQDYSDINLQMIVEGCAYVYSPSRSEREKYKAAFAAAFAARVGMFDLPPGRGASWRSCQPSKFRRGTCAE